MISSLTLFTSLIELFETGHGVIIRNSWPVGNIFII